MVLSAWVSEVALLTENTPVVAAPRVDEHERERQVRTGPMPSHGAAGHVTAANRYAAYAGSVSLS